MKLEFDSPLDYTDGTVIDPTVAATLKYIAFIDTANPPVKSYPIAQSAVTNGTKNANGSVHVVADCVKGDATGFVPVAGTTYYCAVQDSVIENGQTVLSAESNILSVTYEPSPAAPANFSIA